MVKKTVSMILCAALILPLNGCSSAGASSSARGPEDTVLIQILGVDVDGGGVRLTAAGMDGEESTVMERAWGGTLAEAFAALPGAGEKTATLTNVTQILVGDGVELKPLLEYVLENPDMSYTARVWAAGYAAGVMETLEEGGLGRFEVLERSGAATVSVKTALAELLTDRETALPALAVREDRLEAVGKLYFEVR